MGNLTVQKLGDEAQLDNDPHRLDYQRRDLHDPRITSHKLTYKDIAALGLVIVPGWLIILATVWIVYAVQSWGVPSYAWTGALWLFYGLAMFWTFAPVAAVSTWLAVMVWARVVRTQAETMRARITRDRYSNPVDAAAVIAKTQQQLRDELMLATQSEIQMAPFKQFPAGLDALTMHQTIQAPKQELLEATTTIQPVPVAEWLKWIDQRPHAILAAETGGGKSQ